MPRLRISRRSSEWPRPFFSEKQSSLEANINLRNVVFGVALLKNSDVAFICMNLLYTQTPEEAAERVNKFRPAIVYPSHYCGQEPKFFADELRDEPGIEVRLRN